MYYVKACSVTPTAGKVTHGRPAGFVTDRWRTGWGATLRLATLDTETRLRAFVRHFPTRGAVSSAVKKLELGYGGKQKHTCTDSPRHACFDEPEAICFRQMFDSIS